MIKIDENKIESAKNIYEKLPNWNLANKVLTAYFNANPKNNSEEVILIKVCLIDSLYKTNLKDQISVAKHILGIESLDKDLQEGKVSVVEKIANWNGRNLISFASKFCHFHNKKTYPIYDKYVIIALRKLINWKDTRIFSDFFKAIKNFREENKLNNVSFEDIDKYLWLFGQWEQLKKGKKDINKEIYNFYINNKQLFENL